MQKIPLRHGPGLSAQARNDGKAASGRVGAQEPGYGRPPGECPPELGYGQPNRHGPEYEEGGRYPGARLDDSLGSGRWMRTKRCAAAAPIPGRAAMAVSSAKTPPASAR